jgi:cyclopropane fatty-acyl-phospholipid synthase-like methyltransferase
MTDKMLSVLIDQQHALSHPNFPRSSKYDPDFVFNNNMGPNVLWLTEWLTRDMHLKPGRRVLDMGCGKAISSIFLAQEYGVTVWANDLWIEATENWQRICEVGLQDRVFPIHAEAHALPYAEGFFDAIVSMDSYQYYGTDDLYLGYFHKFLKPGGEIGIVVPGLYRDFVGPIPEHLTRVQKSGGTFWAWDCCTFHTAKWWRKHWSQYAAVTIQVCEAMSDGGTVWLDWEKALEPWPGDKMFPSDIECLEADQNQYLTFVRLIANKIRK